jgi:hypothetical protein
MDDTITKLAINRLIVVPFTIHPVLQTPSVTKLRTAPLIARFASYGDIVNYNTRSRASFFSENFLRQFSADEERPAIAMIGSHGSFFSWLTHTSAADTAAATVKCWLDFREGANLPCRNGEADQPAPKGYGKSD